VIRRRRHSLDLLPLLDVFMVVLFVFATIQEQRLDDTTHDAERLDRALAQAERALEAAALREQAEARERAAGRADEARTALALTEARAEVRRLRGELDELRERVLEQQAETKAELARAGLPAEALQRLDLLSRLLDRHGVIEIELVGQPDESGLPINHCCYRVEPLGSEWRTCGTVPALPEARERWLEDGANGLAEALRRTKGGNAMTLVRQDAGTTHRIGHHLAELLRTRFSDQYVDVEEAGVLTPRCPE